MKAFWAAVQYQSNLLNPAESHIAINVKSAPGLLRLTLQVQYLHDKFLI